MPSSICVDTCGSKPQFLSLIVLSVGWLSSVMWLSLRISHAVDVRWHLDWSGLKGGLDRTSEMACSHESAFRLCTGAPARGIHTRRAPSTRRGLGSRSKHCESQEAHRRVEDEAPEVARHHFCHILLVKTVRVPLSFEFFKLWVKNLFTYNYMSFIHINVKKIISPFSINWAEIYLLLSVLLFFGSATFFFF